MTKLEQLIQQIRVEVGSDFVSTDVVGLDGLSVGGGSMDPNFDASEASARFAMVMKLGRTVGEKLTLGDVEDNLVTTDKAYIIARFIGDGSFYWGIAVTRNATLGAVRMMMNEYADRLWDAIPR